LKKKLGFIVNPLAGIGGRVALKGSDGATIVEEAFKRGAVCLSPMRASEALARLEPIRDQLEIVTYPQEMGENEARENGFEPTVVGHITPGHTTAADTKAAAKELAAAGVDLILFAGGDGTARDIYDSIGSAIPVIGIPTGCKIHSAVYASTPPAAGDLALEYLKGELLRTRELEVMDIDEEAFRGGVVKAHLYGYLKVPDDKRYTQGAKSGGTSGNEEFYTHAIAERVIEDMEPGRYYIVGSGTTIRAVLEDLGLPKTLLGVDIVKDKKLVASDVTEHQILDIIDSHPATIIVTVIGGQGYIFGRGNQQLSPDVIKKVGPKNIRVVATSDKVNNLPDRRLRVDTGDEQVNEMLRGYIKVLMSYGEEALLKVE
jgi:predicted polyphosphate/ATP-dependent NAD kinase